MTVARSRAVAALVAAATLSTGLGVGRSSALEGPPPGEDALGIREMKLQGFAPVAGTWTNRKGKQVRFVGIAYRQETQSGTEATAKEIRTWGFDADGRYERMMSLADVRRLTFVQCDDRFGKRDACANVESRDGRVYASEAFRSDFPEGAWLFLVLRTEKGKEVSLDLDRALKDSSIDFD